MHIAIIGLGVMGQAFARNLALQGHRLFLVGKDLQSIQSLGKELGAVCCNCQSALAQADIVLVAVKPKDLQNLSLTLAPFLTPKHVVISVLAGVSLASLKKLLPFAEIIRIMPNISLATGKSVIGAVEPKSLQTKKLVAKLLGEVGFLYFIEESSIDSFTALSGSMPGFILHILEALVEGGIAIGFSRQIATEIVVKTMLSTLEFASEEKRSLSDLKLKVCSPSGTTIAGIMEMEDRGLRATLYHGLDACRRRSEEIGISLAE